MLPTKGTANDDRLCFQNSSAFWILLANTFFYWNLSYSRPDFDLPLDATPKLPSARPTASQRMFARFKFKFNSFSVVCFTRRNTLVLTSMLWTKGTANDDQLRFQNSSEFWILLVNTFEVKMESTPKFVTDPTASAKYVKDFLFYRPCRFVCTPVEKDDIFARVL